MFHSKKKSWKIFESNCRDFIRVETTTFISYSYEEKLKLEVYTSFECKKKALSNITDQNKQVVENNNNSNVLLERSVSRKQLSL